uniref:NADH dehydrogenase subunit 6 n=1 Tax=Euplotes cristatus TaxID=756077 RepID=UPI002E767D1D|nr:NADH dehydrogenase subunit 6 [Euplotes cristatus]UPM52058.1 NADH dehydrogenase subunit 6 [Euplotes cristatus]
MVFLVYFCVCGDFVCVFLFSEFFFLQVTVLVVLVFFFFIWDSFFLIINAVFFLAVVAFLAWLIDADIYINFLIIIDLGVFFILLGFLLNFVSVFTATRPGSYRREFFVVFFLFFLLVRCGGSSVSGLVLFLPNAVTFYDWYAVFNLFYFTDLQLLSDIYYTLSGFEFIVMNFYLYVIIVCLYVLRRCRDYELSPLPLSFSGGLTVRGNFLRVQDPQAQNLVRASVRTWSRN